MEKDIKVGFVGGDARQIFCAKKLAEQGIETALYGFDKYTGDIGLCTRSICLEDALEMAEAVVLPLPATHDSICVNAPLSDKCINLCGVFERAGDCKKVLYGGACSKIEQLASEHGITSYDYYKREDYKVLNAEPTAEGAIAIAINEMPKTLFGSKCLVIGYGRIGKVLCRMLTALGAEVYASARKSEDLAWASLSGCKTVKTSDIAIVLPECDLVLNTVPKTILKDELLDIIKKETLIIDLASKPGGIDFKPAKQKGLNVIWALSLPGKTAPVSAGNILADTVMKILKESESE